jgi:hypothetical protein
METIVLEKTKKNHPAIWEWGGALTSSGEAQVICGQNFEKLRPIYNVNFGHRSNGKHSLFLVKEGMHIILVKQYRNNIEKIKILKINKIEKTINQNNEEMYIAICSIENTYEENEWEKPIPDDENFKSAIECAIQKSQCYHCRNTHYSLPILNKPI